MDRFVQTLVAVIEANQRFLLKRAVVQLLFLAVAAIGLWRLLGAMWWLSLVLFVLFVLAVVLGAFQLKIHLTMKVEPPWRAIGLQPPYGRSREQVLELHLPQGGVELVAVHKDMVAGVLSAAREAGLEVVTEPEALKELKATSERLERIREIRELIPFVPTPELRDELSSALSVTSASDEVLKQLEIQLMAEKSAQTTTSLRGPKPVFEKELRGLIAKLG